MKVEISLILFLGLTNCVYFSRTQKKFVITYNFMFLLVTFAVLPFSSGLHDNPWLCDCRLYDLVQFQKSPSSSVALIDTRLRCADPESLSGVLFTEAELQRCQGPRVHTAVARVRSSLGNNVLLRCGTVGVPIPELSWSRADGKRMNGTGEFC